MAVEVEIKRLCKSFGALRAVDDVSFTVRQGEVLGFLGPNGAGKSTTMKMVTGFLAPTSGTAVVCGHDVVADPLAVKRRIGYLPEGAPSYGEMSPRGFLEFVAGVRGFSPGEARGRIAAAVAATGLEDVLNQRFETLSKGFKRRVGLAQAILHDPDVLILDEPTDGLDPNQKHEVRELIRRMAADKVIILSTHILEEVDAVCTRAIVISGGKLRADGTPGELLARSARVGWVRLALRGGEGAAMVGALSAVAGVAGVTALPSHEGDHGLVRLSVRPVDGAHPAPALAAAVAGAGWELHELETEVGRLDEVFREITLGAGSHS